MSHNFWMFSYYEIGRGRTKAKATKKSFGSNESASIRYGMCQTTNYIFKGNTNRVQQANVCSESSLTYFMSMFLFYAPWKYRKAVFLMFSGTESPANIYLFNVNNENTRKRYKICSKLTMKTPEQCQWLPSDVFIVNFEHISHLFVVFLLLTLNK